MIAHGFPIPERCDNELGLEISVDIMASLCGARHAIEIEGGLVIKGFSTMLIPIASHQSSIQWHLIQSKDDTRLSYREAQRQCPSRCKLEDVNCHKIKSSRAILGWWSVASTHLGSLADTDWSEAEDAGRQAKLSGGIIGFQYMFIGQMSLALGAKDGNLHVSCQGRFENLLSCAEKTPVVYYDCEDRRAWLLSAIDVMLHIFCTRSVQNQYHTNIFAQYIKDIISGASTPLASAKSLFAKWAAQELSKPELVATQSYCIKDAISDIWSLMERLIEKENIVKTAPGVNVHGTTQASLYGWEFMALIEEKNCMRRKQQKLNKSHGGWANLITDIDAVVLFGARFGDIITPSSIVGGPCERWRQLPKGGDYLAVRCGMLENLYTEAGSRKSRRYLTSSHLQWHRGDWLFEKCNVSSAACDCNRVQQLFYDDKSTFGRIEPPGDLPQNGCVVFGRSHHALIRRKPTTPRTNSVHMLPNVPLHECSDERKNQSPPAACKKWSGSSSPHSVDALPSSRADTTPEPCPFEDASYDEIVQDVGDDTFADPIQEPVLQSLQASKRRYHIAGPSDVSLEFNHPPCLSSLESRTLGPGSHNEAQEAIQGHERGCSTRSIRVEPLKSQYENERPPEMLKPTGRFECLKHDLQCCCRSCYDYATVDERHLDRLEDNKFFSWYSTH